MSEKAPKPSKASPPKISIVNQFISDFSFENIAAQKSLAKVESPEINVQVNLNANKHSDESYKVILTIKASAKNKDQDVFLLELDYAGIFKIDNVPDEHIHPVLMIECPRLLFPFSRRIIRDTVADGGFPPLNIDNLDFLQLYQGEIEKRKQAGAKKGEDKKTLN